MIYRFLKGVLNSLARLSENSRHSHTRVVPTSSRKVCDEGDYCRAIENSDRVVFLNNSWDFCYFSEGIAKNIFNSDTAKYSTVDLPCSWQDAGVKPEKYLEGYSFGRSGKKLSSGKDSNNGSAVYRRTVDIFDLTKNYFLTFDRVEGYFEVYCNGKLVGFSYEGRAEFDVTGFITSGTNELLVLVKEHTKASFLSGESRFERSGIVGDVYFVVRNDLYLADMDFTSSLEEDSDGVYQAALTLTLAGERPDSEVMFSLEKDGKTIFEQTVKAEAAVKYDFSGKFEPYNNENPALYDLYVTIKELDYVLECSHFKLGFGEMKYIDGVACYNGAPIKMYGIGYNAIRNACGKPMTFEDYEADFLILKKFGYNVLFDKVGLPDAAMRLALCRGLYVVKNIPVNPDKELIAKKKHNFVAYDTEFKDLVINTAKNAYSDGKAYCNVLAYSLCNNSLFAGNIAAAYRALKELGKPNVLVADAPDSEAAIIVRPSVDDFIDEINKVSAERPIYMSDYAESYGVGNANLSEFAELVENTPCAMGGIAGRFVDDYIEGVANEDCGMFTADRKPYASAYCHRYIARPIKVKSVDDGKIEISNNSYFNDTSYIDIMISVVKNGKLVSKVMLNVTVEPRQTRVFDIFTGHKDGDMYLNVECFMKGTQELISTEQVTLNSDMVGLGHEPQPTGDLFINEKFDVTEIRFAGGSARFSAVTGTLIGYNINGKEILNPIAGRKGGACFNTKINRPFVRNINDGKYCFADYETVDYNVSNNGDSAVVTIKQLVKLKKKTAYTVKDRYTVYGDGTIDLTSVLTPAKKCPATLDCFGKQIRFYPSFEKIVFYGKGDGDNYIDMCKHSVMGIYETTATEMSSGCLFGQECGNRTDVHYVLARDGEGDGIMVEAVENPVQIRVSTASDYDIVESYKSKTAAKTSGVYVDINAVVSGYGSGNGAKPLARYTLMSGEHTLKIKIIPVCGPRPEYEL